MGDEKKTEIKWLNIKMNFLMVIVSLLILFPVVLVIAASFRVQGHLYELNLFKFWTTENYYELLTKTHFLNWMKNTLFLCLMCSFIGLLAAATAGYAFSRFRFRGRTTGLLLLILLQMFPAAMAMVAIFKLLLVLGKSTGGMIGINSFTGLLLVYVGGSIPFNAWLIKSYLDSIPKELEESAYIDGCSPWKTFFKIIFPLMSPILIVVAIFNFILPYADFIFPSIVLMDESKYTLAVGMRAFILNNFSTNWSQFAAASVLGAIPILILFFGMQKYLVEGLTKGAVKG